MVSDPPETPPGSGSGESPDAAGDKRPVDGGVQGLRPVDPGVPPGGLEAGGHPDPQVPDGAPAGGTPGERNDAAHSLDQGATGGAVPPPGQSKRKRLSKTEVSIALREAEGNVALAARALDTGERNVHWWIANDTELNALYGGMSAASKEVKPPEGLDVLTRSPEEAPAAIVEDGVPPPKDINMALAIAESDMQAMRDGLKRMGIGDSTLAKLKELDTLAKNDGLFLSISLRTTHRMYFVQAVNLMETADGLKKRYLDPVQDPDKAPGETKENNNCNAEERAYFYKCYHEMVKESGRAYSLMMAGTEAMVRMLKAATGDDKPRSKKPKWHERGNGEKK